MRWIFDINNPIMRYVIKVFDCMCLSVLWLVVCLPIVTIGPATTAMFAVIHRYIRLEEESLWKMFWKTFREEFKRTSLCWLAALGILILLIVDALVFRTMEINGQFFGKLYWLILLLIGIVATWITYLFSYAERFDGGVKDTLKLSFLMMVLHPIKSITILIILVASAALIILFPGFLTIVPAVCCWLCDVLTASVFVLHLREEDRQRLEDSRKESAEDI